VPGPSSQRDIVVATTSTEDGEATKIERKRKRQTRDTLEKTSTSKKPKRDNTNRTTKDGEATKIDAAKRRKRTQQYSETRDTPKKKSTSKKPKRDNTNRTTKGIHYTKVLSL
jgi:hypothetical protein